MDARSRLDGLEAGNGFVVGLAAIRHLTAAADWPAVGRMLTEGSPRTWSPRRRLPWWKRWRRWPRESRSIRARRRCWRRRSAIIPADGLTIGGPHPGEEGVRSTMSAAGVDPDENPTGFAPAG